jgi:hypothetical protein
MKVNNQANRPLMQRRAQQQQLKGKQPHHHEVKDKVHISVKPHQRMSVGQNSPKDPTVPTKVLDSLDSGMIDFSQEQRDVIAKILSEKAEAVKAKEDSWFDWF